MKQLNNFINEKLKVSSKSKVNNYNYFPKNKKELRDIVNKLIKERGKNADLNDIDTSEIKDMSYLFNLDPFDIGNIDISNWDVSNVKNMGVMFSDCKKFDCDLSKWDVSKVTSMKYMFDNCYNFRGKGLDKWNIENLEYTYNMLRGTKVPQNIIDKFNKIDLSR